MLMTGHYLEVGNLAQHLAQVGLLIGHMSRNVLLGVDLLLPDARIATMGHAGSGVRCFHLVIVREVEELLDPAEGLRDLVDTEAMADNLGETKAVKGLHEQLGGRETLRV